MIECLQLGYNQVNAVTTSSRYKVKNLPIWPVPTSKNLTRKTQALQPYLNMTPDLNHDIVKWQDLRRLSYPAIELFSSCTFQLTAPHHDVITPIPSAQRPAPRHVISHLFRSTHFPSSSSFSLSRRLVRQVFFSTLLLCARMIRWPRHDCPTVRISWTLVLLR